MNEIIVPFEVKAVKDDGTFEGYGAVFGNVDLGRDRIHKGAFAETIKKVMAGERKIKMLWQHDRHQPIGTYKALREDDNGLYVEGRFTKGVQRADEAHLLMKDGALDGLSIGFNTKQYSIDKEELVRDLIELDLHEISPVTFPMNTGAIVTAVKSVRDFEEWLTRDAGLTRKEALIVINQGFKAYKGMRDAASDDAGLRDSILRNITILGGK